MDDSVAFPVLDESELGLLGSLGIRRSMAHGEYLYREGDATYDFFVVLSGAAEIMVLAGVSPAPGVPVTESHPPRMDGRRKR